MTEEQQRRTMCLQCARIIAEEGVRDFQQAKRKAGERLNMGVRQVWPTNLEIDQAVRDYVRVFMAARFRANLKHQLALAREALDNLGRFRPRVVGPLVRGTVTDYSVLELHLFADTFEEVNLYLAEQGIDSEIRERRYRFGGDRVETRPVCQFTADGVVVELTVFGHKEIREAPLCPVDGAPMRRLDAKALEQLAFKERDEGRGARDEG